MLTLTGSSCESVCDAVCGQPANGRVCYPGGVAWEWPCDGVNSSNCEIAFHLEGVTFVLSLT